MAETESITPPPDTIQIVTKGDPEAGSHLDVQEIAGTSILTFNLRLGGYTMAEMLNLGMPLPAPREVQLDVTYKDGRRATWSFGQDGYAQQEATTPQGKRVLRLESKSVTLTRG